MSETLTISTEDQDERTLTPDEVRVLRDEYSQNKEADNAKLEKLNQVTEEFISSLEQEASPESSNILDLMLSMPPRSMVEAGGQSFLLSDPVTEGYRMYAVGYVIDESQQVAPRLFYKSKSEGEWRVAPYAEVDANQKASYLSKGEKFDMGYVRETRLNDYLRIALNENEATVIKWERTDIDKLYSKFTVESLGNRNIYLEVADTTRLRNLPDAVFRFSPGEGFDTSEDEPSPAEQLANIQLDETIEPQFDNGPTLQYTSEHSILGLVVNEVYSNATGNLNWHVSHDTQGRVWLSGITSSDENSTSYGTSEEVLLGGVLDNKPVEYIKQVGGLSEGVDYEPLAVHKNYVDITPLLDNLLIIKKYRATKNIYRKNPQ